LLTLEGLEYEALVANPAIHDRVVLTIKDNVLKVISQPDWSRDTVGVELSPGSVNAKISILAVPQVNVGAAEYESLMTAMSNNVDFTADLMKGVSQEIPSIEGVQDIATGSITADVYIRSWSTTYTTTTPVPEYIACPLDEMTMPCKVQDALLLLTLAVTGPVAFCLLCWVTVWTCLKCRRVKGGKVIVKDFDNKHFEVAFRIVRGAKQESEDPEAAAGPAKSKTRVIWDIDPLDIRFAGRFESEEAPVCVCVFILFQLL
jgi:hypothetical protein